MREGLWMEKGRHDGNWIKREGCIGPNKLKKKDPLGRPLIVKSRRRRKPKKED